VLRYDLGTWAEPLAVPEIDKLNLTACFLFDVKLNGVEGNRGRKKFRDTQKKWGHTINLFSDRKEIPIPKFRNMQDDNPADAPRHLPDMHTLCAEMGLSFCCTAVTGCPLPFAYENDRFAIDNQRAV
jgi:hypothetical protein